ncbi:MAG: hypothetical protein NT151_09320 [Acidobacteria bacterium]|nr:hypothetical protein [Acidobacteriota bacterium]
MLEFLRSTGEQVRLLDLGAEFSTQQGVPTDRLSGPFRISIGRRQSKAGNAFYEYSQNNLPLPDGLSTWLRIEGVVVPMGRIRPSQKGHPTREGAARIVVGGVLYVVTAYLTESKTPYWVKVLAHKVPDSSAALKKAQSAPRGGSIVY